MNWTSTDSRAVVATFDLNHNLIFRAALELRRRQLVVGLFLTALFIGGVIYFFLLLDERTILWQTAPLFIGLPLVAFGGQILRLHATARKYVSSLSPSKRTIQYMFYVNADGYDITSGESSGHIAWRDMFKVVEKRSYFLFYLNRFEVNVIPESAFAALDVPTFRAIVKSSLGERGEVNG